MTTNGADPRTPRDALGHLSLAQTAWDLVLAAGVLAITLVINLSGAESVAENRAADLLTVGLTVAAVAPVALRRRFPLSVLVVTSMAVLALVAVRGTVGTAPLGPVIALYTAVALGSVLRARAAVGVVLAAGVVTAVLRPVDLSLEGALITLVLFSVALMLAIGTRARRELFVAEVEAAEQRAELQRERARAEHERAARTATQERLRIARELHDVIGHGMSVMVVQAGVAERLLDSRPDDARRAVEEIGRTGRRALAEMRQLLGTLRDGEGDGDGGELSARGPAPTLADVDALAGRVVTAGLPVDVTVLGVRAHLPAGIDLAAYRVVQEALTNCLRHAGATRAAVTVTYRPESVEAEIVDDGAGLGGGACVGADAAAGGAAGAPAGSGLAGMRERVAIYGGQLSVGPLDGKGFRVHARFPFAVPVEVVTT